MCRRDDIHELGTVGMIVPNHENAWVYLIHWDSDGSVETCVETELIDWKRRFTIHVEPYDAVTVRYSLGGPINTPEKD